MSKFKRSISEERRILTANGLQNMLLEIRTKFITQENMESFIQYCNEMIAKHQNIFSSQSIEIEINNAKS